VSKEAIMEPMNKVIFNLTSPSHTVIILFIWFIETLALLFDNKKSIENKLINISALVTSTVFTFRWGGIKWVVVPIVAVPFLSGLIHGILAQTINSYKSKKPNSVKNKNN
jgi:hypothetical protein